MHRFNANQLTIIGTGLLGGSVALALRQAGFTGKIVGVGRRQETLDTAIGVGCIDTGTTDLAAGVAEADVVLIATPVQTITHVLRDLAGCVGEATIVTDVGSTKRDIVATAEDVLPHAGRFVGSHPMAGNTGAGPEAADAQLLAGKPCIVTPTKRTDAEALATVEAMWRTLAMNLLTMNPAEHDLQTALVSHLPHAAAVMLVLTAAAEGGWDVASTGFKSTTRLASSNPPMRADIMINNRAALLDAIGAFEKQLADLRGKLESEDYDGVLDMLNRAKDIRDAWVEVRFANEEES